MCREGIFFPGSRVITLTRREYKQDVKKAPSDRKEPVRFKCQCRKPQGSRGRINQV
jgi:hypothetical protein